MLKKNAVLLALIASVVAFMAIVAFSFNSPVPMTNASVVSISILNSSNTTSLTTYKTFHQQLFTSFSEVQICKGNGGVPCTFGSNMGFGNTIYIGVEYSACGAKPAFPTFTSSGISSFTRIKTRTMTHAFTGPCSSIPPPITIANVSNSVLQHHSLFFDALTNASVDADPSYIFNTSIYSGVVSTAGYSSISCDTCDYFTAMDTGGNPSPTADATSSNTDSSGTAMTVVPYAPTAGDFVFASGAGCGTGTYSAGTGYTLASSQAGTSCGSAGEGQGGLGVEYLLSSSGTQTSPMTDSVSSLWGEASAAFAQGTTTSTTTTTTTTTTTVAAAGGCSWGVGWICSP